jgi:archaeal flagellar protein FlaF
MGLDTVVVAFFVIGTIMVVACTLTIGANNLIKSSYDGYITISQTTMDRLHTDIKLNNITFDGTNVHLTVENTGETKLSNFDLWDIIVVEEDQAFYLRNNTDFGVTFTRNIINPGIFDPNEIIDIKLPPNFNSGESLLIKVITENGIASSANYTVTAGG